VGFLGRGDHQPPTEGAALIGVTARSRRVVPARRGAGDSGCVVPWGCQNALCQEGPSLLQLLGDLHTHTHTHTHTPI